ncbi:nuclear transport factor 2 family protein [Sediminicola sp. YIK13]|uniref:nuclear transport factor 2 family protein n=1 Tax=Sediminicola sp. YIK13 TaxID=1453352 RepID=UPI001F166774|nr:nuclear transport factor 2 family protein [Sediminicola sp. YIK13]
MNRLLTLKQWIMNLKATIFGLLVFFTCGQIALAQSMEIEKEITELSKQKWQWMADKNADSLAVLFHDKAKFVHMGGTWGKDREVDIIRSGFIHYKKADVHEVMVEVLNETTVILWNQITLLAVVGDNEVTTPFMVTEVYVKQDDEWKLADLTFSKLMTRD